MNPPNQAPSSQPTSTAPIDTAEMAEAISPESRIPRLQRIHQAILFEKRFQDAVVDHLNEKLKDLSDELSRQEEIQLAFESAADQIEEVIRTENEA